MPEKFTAAKLLDRFIQEGIPSPHRLEVVSSDLGEGWIRLLVDDVDVVLACSDLQIVVSTPLEAVSAIRDEAAFNRRILETQRLLPLSSFAIVEIDGVDVYELMGEMSAASPYDVVVEEILTTARNAREALESIVEWNASAPAAND